MPLLGWISPVDRTATQEIAHINAISSIRSLAHYALPCPTLAKGEMVRLTSLWKDSRVVADVGFAFDRIHQLTGSCVWAGGTNAVFSTIAAQRVASSNPTKAFLPFTLQNYAMSRHYMGDDGQGEGSMGSTFAKSLNTDGVTAWVQGGSLPKYTDSDGVSVTSRDEMTWSSVRSSVVAPVLAESKAHLFGSAAQCNSVQDIKAAVLNGYGVSFACDNYIGHASIQGDVVVGHWDGRGGHQQSIHDYLEHATLGPLYWAQNNWPGSTYPRDPLGGPVCGCWVTEANVEAAMRLNAEVYALSHLNWFPAQPEILNYVP